MDLLFLRDVITVRAMKLYLKHSLLARVCSKGPLQIWGAFAGSWISVCGRPRTNQMDADGEWGHENRTDFCTQCAICLYFRERGAHARRMDRRNELAHSIDNRLAADDGSSSHAISKKAPFRLDAMLSHPGFAAYQMAFGSTPAGL